MVLYGVRVMLLQGWYIITYALAIYLLNLLIAFLSPKFDPALQEETEIGTLEVVVGLPTPACTSAGLSTEESEYCL